MTSDPTNFQKVTTTKNGVMHIATSSVGGRTLCGRRWHFHCDHGLAYCSICQRALAKRYRPKA